MERRRPIITGDPSRRPNRGEAARAHDQLCTQHLTINSTSARALFDARYYYGTHPRLPPHLLRHDEVLRRGPFSQQEHTFAPPTEGTFQGTKNIPRRAGGMAERATATTAAREIGV